MRFRLPNLDLFSFWLGFILASVFWWVISMLRPAFRQMREAARIKQAERKERARTSTAVEQHYRELMLLYSQGQHLAASLFSLDEILIPPRLLAAPPRVGPDIPIYNEDIVDITLPYLPAWPEIGSIYKATTLTLAQALSGNSDIVLVGQTGSGKTVALASLASALARRESDTGLPPDTIPVLVHVADLALPASTEKPLKPIVDFLSEKAAVLNLSKIPEFIQHAFTEGRVLLLLDGTDELTPDGLKEAVEFIKVIKRTYKKTRIVTTASIEFLDGLVSLNFTPVPLAAWNSEQRDLFLHKWADVWSRFVAVETWAQISDRVDPLLLNGWLSSEPSNLTPLEITLKAWAAYAGDLRGARVPDMLEAHLRRLTPANSAREALEVLALQITMNKEPIFDPRKAREWVKSFEPEEAASPADGGTPEKVKNKTRKQAKVQAPSMGLISKLVESGLLSQHRDNRMRFVQPLFGGYLAGKALARHKADISNQPPWIGKFLAMHFMASEGDASQMVAALLAQTDRPLSRNLLIPGRWLRDAPRQAAWRGNLMSRLVELLEQRGQPLGLRGQAMAALVVSNDPGVASLFRQLFNSNDNELVQLAVIGAGAIQDPKAIEPVVTLLDHQLPSIRRSACLALASIGTTPALDGLASALLHGDEHLRQSAAEAIANHPREGHAMLREGAGMKTDRDLDVRRAAVYGLSRIHEPWATELLNKLQIEDDQWAVRDATQLILQERLKPNPHIPKRLLPPSESPWLIAFAGKHGLGISPDRSPVDILLLALKSGEPEERLAALPYLRIQSEEGVFNALYNAMYGGDVELREAAFNVISEIAGRGVKVPDPTQFGMGD
jgi:hypothetical protein